MPKSQQFSVSPIEMVHHRLPLQIGIFLVLTGLLGLSACAPDEAPSRADGVAELQLVPVDVPAVGSSGEPYLSLAGGSRWLR
jgi:hypothetical protein